MTEKTATIATPGEELAAAVRPLCDRAIRASNAGDLGAVYDAITGLHRHGELAVYLAVRRFAQIAARGLRRPNDGALVFRRYLDLNADNPEVEWLDPFTHEWITKTSPNATARIFLSELMPALAYRDDEKCTELWTALVTGPVTGHDRNPATVALETLVRAAARVEAADARRERLRHAHPAARRNAKPARSRTAKRK